MTLFLQCIALLALSLSPAASEGDSARPIGRGERIEKSPDAATPAERAATEDASLDLLDWADSAVAAAARTTDIDLWIMSLGHSVVTVAPGATVRYRVIGELSDDHNEGLALVGFDLHFEGGPLQQADEPTGDPNDGCENPMIHFDKPWGITNPAGFGGTIIGGDLIQCGGGQNTVNNPPGNADFPIGPVLTGVAQPSGCEPAVILTGSLTAPQAEGSYELVISNVFANIIKEGETGEVFFATEAAGMGMLRNLTVIVGPDATMPAHLNPRPIK